MRLTDVPATCIAKPIQNDPTGFLEDYSQEVRDGLVKRYLDNLEWAKNFMNSYEKKYKKPRRF